MQTEAVFENIAERILEEISSAKKSIFIAVAWFTNKRLFNELINKAKNGCTVSLIISNDPINHNSQIDFEQINIRNSHVYWVGNGETELMHNKFCVIDFSTVLTGSYNWSYKAENNFENIIINQNDTTLAEQFITEFTNIRKQFYPDEKYSDVEFPLNKIIKRLEILNNYIMLEDIEELNKETDKLNIYEFNTDILEIIEEIRNKEFGKAVSKIQDFIAKNRQLSIWTDPIIAALKLEIKTLESILNAFDNEKVELEKILAEFQHKHTSELGEIILEILKLRKIKFKSDKAKFEEAENDEREYFEQYTSEKDKKIIELTIEQKKELKKNFRKATTLCHPDKFVNESKEIQDLAEELFKELNEANAKNDLKRVSEILSNLEKGILSTSRGDKLSDIDKLKSTIEILKNKIKRIENEITLIRYSDTFKTIINISDWEEYFKITKEKLNDELIELKKEIYQ